MSEHRMERRGKRQRKHTVKRSAEGLASVRKARSSDDRTRDEGVLSAVRWESESGEGGRTPHTRASQGPNRLHCDRDHDIGRCKQNTKQASLCHCWDLETIETNVIMYSSRIAFRFRGRIAFRGGGCLFSKDVYMLLFFIEHRTSIMDVSYTHSNEIISLFSFLLKKLS